MTDLERKRTTIGMRRVVLRAITAVLVAGGAGLAAVAWLVRAPLPAAPAAEQNDDRDGRETLPVYGKVSDFALVERSGRRVTLADLLGTVWVADFVYTRCTDTCRLESAQMARLQADLSAQPGVRLVSFSVDPEYDTPRVLSRYATRFGADADRWLFLTGDKADVYQLLLVNFHIGVVQAGDTERRPIHSSSFAVVDQQARIRGYYEGTDWVGLKRLRGDLQRLLRGRGLAPMTSGPQAPAARYEGDS